MEILLYILSIVIFYVVVETAVKNGINKSIIGQKNNDQDHEPFIKNDLDDWTYLLTPAKSKYFILTWF